MDEMNLPATLPTWSGEIAMTAAAAHAKATVESRYIIALRSPRNMDQVRQDTLRECKIPSFAANKSTYYHKPIGKGVEGLGIRFVEMALRNMRNVLVESTMVYEDEAKEVHRVAVTDLENNITYPLDIKVSKTVERGKPSDDGSFLAVRKNSYGKETYTVAANDDDLLNKRAALISKAVRTLGLRIIPGDIQDEAKEVILKIRADKAAKDPAGERKAICDGFASLGVRASDLAEYLGHDIDQCSPAQLVELRGLWGAIANGEATWKTVTENSDIKKESPPAKVKTKTEIAPATDPKRCSATGRLVPAGCQACKLAAKCDDERNPNRVIAPIICPVGGPASGEAVTREQCDGCPILKSEPGCISWPKKENYT